MTPAIKRLLIVVAVATLVLGGFIFGLTLWFTSSAVDSAMQNPRRVVSGAGLAPSFVNSFIWIAVAITLATLAVVGGLIFYARRAVRGMMQGDQKLLTYGLPGTGLVLAVRDTGTTINNIYAVIEVRLRVSLPGRADYEAAARTMLGRLNFGAIQPGMTLNLRVDPANPLKVEIDRAAPAAQPPGAAPAAHGALSTPGGTFNVPGVAGNLRADKVRRADDVIAEGSKGQAVIQSVSHTGATAGQMAPGAKLDASKAKDPMIYLAFQVEPEDGTPPFASQGVHRVPEKHLGKFVIGKRVPVAFLPGEPGTATIDWPRLR